MAKMTPLQAVKDRFGGKDELAKLLYGKLERPYEDEEQEDFERRVRTMSNKKLLRLYEAHTELESKFGNKAGLIDAIMNLRYADAKPDLQYRSKIEGLRITRLLDLHRSLARAAK